MVTQWEDDTRQPAARHLDDVIDDFYVPYDIDQTNPVFRWSNEISKRHSSWKKIAKAMGDY